MKTLLLLLLLSIGIPVLGQNIPSKVKDLGPEFTHNYNKFTDTYAVYSSSRINRAKENTSKAIQLSFGIYYLFKVETPSVQKYQFVFTSETYEWEFLRDNNLWILADNSRINVGTGKHEGKVKPRISGYKTVVNEAVSFDISADDMKKIGESKKVEIRVGRFEGELSALDISRIGSLASLSQK